MKVQRLCVWLSKVNSFILSFYPVLVMSMKQEILSVSIS